MLLWPSGCRCASSVLFAAVDDHRFGFGLSFRNAHLGCIVTPEVEEFTNKVVGHLAKRLNPHQIILFGSHAKGTATADSDIDLLVVLPEFPDSDRRRKWVDVREALHEICGDELGIPDVDTIVASPSRIARYGHVPGLALHEALRNGKVMYG